MAVKYYDAHTNTLWTELGIDVCMRYTVRNFPSIEVFHFLFVCFLLDSSFHNDRMIGTCR